jgi:hypothetical protein
MNRNRKQTFSFSLRILPALVLASGMMLLSGNLYAQQAASPSDPQYSSQRPGQQPQPGQTPDQSAQPAPDSQAQAGPGAVQVFSGTIVKSGDKYVLQDSASGNTYDIDAQDQVKQFEGKKVRVHGTLDASGKMIHVQ